MLPDRVSNPGPLTYESGALPIALRGPAESVDGRQTDDRRTTEASHPISSPAGKLIIISIHLFFF